MLDIFNIFGTNLITVIKIIIVIVFVYSIFNLLLRILKNNLIKLARNKRQVSNIEIFLRILKYVFNVLIIMLAIAYYSDSWAGLGMGIGLISASVGWALQRPISGIAGWIMVVTKRPFNLGDIIYIDGIKGSVIDIDLMHIHIKEIGGTIQSEESSGRTVMIPNSLLFEKSIINYTHQNDYVLDEVILTVTYESNLDRAMKISLEAVEKITKEFSERMEHKPYVRTFFQANGIEIHVRYFVPASERQKYLSEITQEIFRRVIKIKDVSIAYPHTEIVYKKIK